MPRIVSIGICPPPYVITQERALSLVKDLFGTAFQDIKRLLAIFENGHIEKRYFVKDISWFQTDHTLEERNNAYIENAVALGVTAIESCLHNSDFLKRIVSIEEVEAFFF